MGVGSPATLVFFTFIIACSSLTMAKFDCQIGITLTSSEQISNQTLRQLCDSTCYNYLIIPQDLQSPLISYDPNNTADDIAYCQQEKGVKVLLSLTGPVCGEALFPPELTAYMVWELFLNPNGTMSGRYGNTKFDGIDFGYTNGTNDYYHKLALGLKNFSNEIILSASPGCAYPSPYFNGAINDGLFDLIWPKFYNDKSCDYTGGMVRVEEAWKKWDSSIPNNTQLLYGVPTSPKGVESGYVPSKDFRETVLSNIAYTKQYAGAMLWNLVPDQVNNLYAPDIAKEVCQDSGKPITCHVVKVGSLISQVV